MSKITVLSFGSLDCKSCTESMDRIKNIIDCVELECDMLSFYYESDPTKNWLYVNAVETVPPPPPTAIHIAPNTPKEQILLSWLKLTGRLVCEPGHRKRLSRY